MRVAISIVAGVAAAALLCLHAPAQARDSALTLEETYRIALENNEQVQVSRERLQQAKKQVDVATSGLLPQVSAEARHVRQKEFGFGGTAINPDDYNEVSLGLSQHLYQAGKVWSARQGAQYAHQGSRYRHFRRKQEILFNAGARFYDVLLGSRAIEIAENALKRAQRQLERAKGRYEVGVVTRTDVLRARVQVAQAREQLERARNQRAVAQENLALELGMDEVPGEVKEPPQQEFSDKSMRELYRIALRNRRDLQQARSELNATREEVDREWADFFPEVSASASYARTDEEDRFYGQEDTWQASLQVSYPLFSGGRNTAEYHQAKSGVREARQGLMRLKRSIRTQVRSVYLDIQTQHKVIRQLREQVQTARRNYRQVTAQFEEGVATAVDQVDAFTALNEAENRLAQAYYTNQLNILQLRLTIGTFQQELLGERSS
jgi:TolC family type I secretion outer membrane protein